MFSKWREFGWSRVLALSTLWGFEQPLLVVFKTGRRGEEQC